MEINVDKKISYNVKVELTQAEYSNLMGELDAITLSHLSETRGKFPHVVQLKHTLTLAVNNA